MYNNMKSILQFLFPMCGVFGVVDADEVKSVSVMEGYYVTLNPDVTEIQGFILRQWRFGASGSVIAETVGTEISYPHHTEIFRDRLLLDHQTGSLTIKNMRIKHSGLYQLAINHSAGTSYMTFNVTVYDSPAVNYVEMKSVVEGDIVTLQTDVTETLRDELIVWRFGEEGKLIAKHDIEAKSLTKDTDVRFRGRLKLDHQTGSLTITNTSTTDSGVYTVMISSSKQTLYKRFNVTISEAATEGDSHVKEEKRIESGLSSGAVAGIVFGVQLLVFAVGGAGVFYYLHKICNKKRQMGQEKAVLVMEGDVVNLKSDAEIQRDDRIVWMFRPQETLITERPGNRETYEVADGKFKDRLKLDEQTGSLTIRVFRTTDTGVFKLQIESYSGVSCKTISVIVRGNGVNESEIPLLT